MMREIYLDGEKFTTMKNAVAYLRKRFGKGMDYTALRRAADRDGMIGGGTGEQVRVSWKREEPVRIEPEEAARVTRKREEPVRIKQEEAARVIRKREEPVRIEREEPVRVIRKREPLLRYPAREGPQYDGNRTWN
jgi:hypothetical protein